mgnify:CR=1 FL=1
MDIILFLIGTFLLWLGAELLITYSIKIASAINISKLFIGLTIVALGTSLPELIVNVFASLKGETDIVIGNVIGSNIANIGLVLAFSLFIRKMNLNLDYLNKDFLLLFFSTLAVGLFIYMGKMDFKLAFLLLGMLITYIYVQYLKDGNDANENLQNNENYNLKMFFFVFAGLTSLGLPGLSGFAAEILIFLGVFKSYGSLGVLFGSLAVAGAGITAIYILRLVSKVFFGRPDQNINNILDTTKFENMAGIILVVLILFGGLYPLPFIDMITSGVTPILNNILGAL